jgi:hypothetical protein
MYSFPDSLIALAGDAGMFHGKPKALGAQVLFLKIW